jgi:hypothetical protein
MRILSFDVGIKNLAYCYFESECSTIIDWAVVDLCNDKRACTTAGCVKNASFSKHGDFFCNKHAKDFVKAHPWLSIPAEKACCGDVAEMTLPKLKKLATGIEYVLPSGKCPVDELRENICNHISDNLMESVMTRNAKNVDLVEIGVNMDKYFSQLFNDDTGLLKPDVVIIENQISPIANRMKTIQGMIAQFFITRFRGAVIPVKFISSSNKLRDFLTPEELAGGTTYDERKRKGIVATRELVCSHEANRERWLDVFEKHSKKDDLADSLLQGIWYARHSR